MPLVTFKRTYCGFILLEILNLSKILDGILMEFYTNLLSLKAFWVKFGVDPLFFTNLINPIQDGWGQKDPLPSIGFSPVTSRKVGISPQNFLNFSINFLPHCCIISSLYLVPIPNYLTWTKITPQKKRFFWPYPYKIEIMIISLIEMLGLPNFGHMTISTI